MCWQVADLSMGDLLLHNTVIWLNPPASLGKWKKEPELAAFGLYPRTFISDASRAASCALADIESIEHRLPQGWLELKPGLVSLLQCPVLLSGSFPGSGERFMGLGVEETHSKPYGCS